jgi:hypothetical protein
MLRCGLLLAILALPTAARAAAWAATLMAGGFNLQLRHAIMGRRQHDTGRLLDHVGPRNLSEAGRAEVRTIGAGIRRIGIPLGALLPVVVDRDLVAYDHGRDVPASIAALPRVFATAAAPRTNSLLIGHIVALGMATGRSLAEHEDPEGPLAMIRPGGAAGFGPEAIISLAALAA